MNPVTETNRLGAVDDREDAVSRAGASAPVDPRRDAPRRPEGSATAATAE
ncbi:hypothetical protein JD276_13345 [Leucobacter sp. CSA1]|uniref:Uncharacterized protein n=1 Tax=Leucobacter chromiisoli TaxID=2796471 RepID=A0A934QA75_9MICO|nr:hypothetical protein [Leucobacter chromiisoli]MBK0420016.1 hypothetical protein [Leucobacter chromiisoli]